MSKSGRKIKGGINPGVIAELSRLIGEGKEAEFEKILRDESDKQVREKFVEDINKSRMLIEAARKGSVVMTKALLNYGADVNVKNDKRETPLSVSDPKVFKLLFEAQDKQRMLMKPQQPTKPKPAYQRPSNRNKIQMVVPVEIPNPYKGQLPPLNIVQKPLPLHISMEPTPPKKTLPPLKGGAKTKQTGKSKSKLSSK